MSPSGHEGELSVWQLLRLIGAYRSMIAGTVALSLGLALLLLVLVEPVFEARSLILVEPGNDNTTDEAIAAVGIANDSAVIDSQVKVLASRLLARQTIGRLALADDGELSGDGGIEAVIRSFAERLNVERDGGTNAISIAFRSREPDKAARIANELAAIYIEGQLLAKHESTRRGTDWLGAQVEEARARFETAERVLRDYRASSQPAYADAEAMRGIDIANLKRDHIAAMADAAARRSKLERVRRIIDGQPGIQAFEELGGSPVLQNLHALKNQTMRREAELSTDFGTRHPRRLDLRSQLTRIDLQIATEQRALVSRMESELDQAIARETTLRREIDELKQQTLAQRRAQTRIAELERDMEMARRLFESYLGRFEAVAETEEMQRPDARLISEAVPPRYPAFPRPAYVFGSFTVAGLATVLLAIFLLEQKDRGFRTGEHLESALDLPCLALMPVTTQSTGSRIAPHDHVQARPRSRAAETMRGLIASLELADRAPRARAVLVTSALPGEGKSSLTLSLARVAANDGLRVLVVDADLRRPVLHEMLHREAAAGLQEILRGERRVGDVLLADDHSPLMLIPGCPREDQPARLLGRDGLGALIESAREDFDLILVDSAPMMAVADARLIARMVDVTLFVCRFDSTGKAIAVRCVDQLREAGANIAGAVLSRVDPERHGRFGAAEAGIHRRDLAAYYAD